MTARARWLLLVLSLLVGLGGATYLNILHTASVDQRTRTELERVQRESQQDFCDLMRVFDDPAAPPPSTERGRRQVEAIRAYLARRC